MGLFIESFLRVTTEGSRTSTYKHLLLLAFLDVVQGLEEDGDGRALLRVWDLAGRVLAIGRWQVRPYRDRDLRFVHHRQQQAEYVRIVKELAATQPGRASELPRHNRQQQLERLTWAIAQWPLPRLQTVRGQVTQFLFPVPPGWAGLRNRPLPRRDLPLGADGLPQVTLFPGVARLLRRVGGLLRPAIEAEETRHVASLNDILPDPDADLREHLFPAAERQAFPPLLREELVRLQDGQCLWCGRRLGGSIELDHVTPWIIYRNDSIENLVAAHRTCNQSKSDWLLGPALLETYLDHLAAHRVALAAIAERSGWQSDEGVTRSWLRAAYHRYDPGQRIRLWVGYERFDYVAAGELQGVLARAQ